jgi:hypothetical protein
LIDLTVFTVAPFRRPNHNYICEALEAIRAGRSLAPAPSLIAPSPSGGAGLSLWTDDVRLSDIEDRFTCTACGKRGADVRPDFNWNRKQVAVMGYR